MRALHFVFAAMVCCISTSAGAQNNAARADANWLEQVSGYLDEQHQHAEYDPDPSFEDWLVPLDRKFLGSRKASNTYHLEAGNSYMVVGACDADCTDLDLQAFDSTGASVAIDRAYDDHPILRITPITTDDFRVDVWWVSCAATPCYAGVRILRQGTSAGTRRASASAHGTGFLVTSDGYIVTNQHVVDGARSVSVSFKGEEYDAEVVSVDEANDLAILKASIQGIPLSVTSAFDVQRGSEVFTLGYPLIDLQGMEQKAAFGRVNALSGISDDRRYIQMDAPIQPGNSGGPLIDAQGRVVGVVTATLSQSTVLRTSGHIAQNVNYAIKSDYLLPLLPPSARVPWTGEVPASIADAVTQAENSIVLVNVR